MKMSLYNNTKFYDIWQCDRPFPQIDTLLHPPLNTLGSFPTLISHPITPPIPLYQTPKTINTDDKNNTDDIYSSSSDSLKDGMSKNGSNNCGKKKKKLIKKSIHLGACFFPHGCMCGHNVTIRDQYINTRQRRNPNAVTIQIRTPAVKIGLREK